MNLVKLTSLVYSQHFIRLINVFINNIYDVKNEIGLTLFIKLQVKERVHSEMKTFESQYSQFPLWGKVSGNASRTLFVNIIK